jgi:lincosamide nucleotidyltransferase A/C/D/E
MPSEAPLSDEPTTAADVLAILDALDAAGVDWWIGGGWGIDALVGEETRPHSDLDLCIRAEQEALANEALEGCGLRLEVDERPTRFLMAAAGHGAVDVHPLHIAADGTARLQGLDGIEFVFAVGSLDGAGTIGGRSVHCFTSERQRVAHSGYEPRERDLSDLALLDRLGAG